MAQRPTYAGTSSRGYPELASRFRDPADDQDQNNTDTNFAINRIGEGDDQSSQNIPTDARGDLSLVNRVNQWPRENRPFWLLNAEHIEKHRHPNGNGNTQQNLTQDRQGLNQSQQGQQFSLAGDQQRLSGVQQVNTNQDVLPNGGQEGQLQSRFGDSLNSETETIKPLSQRGSFAGNRP